jgi:DNA-binding Lrp family transcriptional regulator
MAIKLDLTDKKILTELDKNCRISDTQLAKKVKKSREAVRYRIQKLQEKGIITGFITSINPNKIGYYMFKVYLKLQNIPKERENFFKELRENKDIYWMGISDGAFDLVFAILSKSITKYYEKINTLLSKWDHLIVSKILGTMVDTRQYNKRFFLENTPTSYSTFGGDIENNKVDNIDLKILDILANDARISLVDLAHKTESTVDIIRTRMKKLEEKKIILSYRVSVDLNKLGLEFYKAILYFKKLSKKDEERLYNWMAQQPGSQHYIRSIAPWEAELEFALENYQTFNKIINDLREKFSDIIRNQEHLIMIYETWMPAYKEMLNPQSPLRD